MKARVVRRITKPSKEIANKAKKIRSLRIEKGFSSYAAFAEKHGCYEKGKDLRFSTMVKFHYG